MSCLDDIISGERVIIGVKDFASCENPESRLYINQLPGMSLKMAAAINPEHTQSGAEFLRESTIMAARQVFDEFAAELQPYFDFRSIVETRGLKVFNSTVIPADNSERGLIIKRWRSEAARLFVESVYIKPKQDGSVTIKVIDGRTTTEFAAELTAECVNEIRLDYKANEEIIKVVFNQELFDTYDCGYSKGSSCSTCGGRSGKSIYVNGWNGSETSQCFGMGVKVHAQCYEENILCSLLPRMYFLMWYKSGILILKELIQSNRINHITTFTRDRAIELLPQYETEYKEKYSTLVKGAYQFLRTTKGECIACNQIRYVQQTP